MFKNKEILIDNGKEGYIKNVRKDILEILESSLNAVDPYNSVKKCFGKKKFKINNKEIDIGEYKNIYLVAFGKASIGMAQAVSDSIEIKKGVVITNEKQRKVESSNVSTYVGSHPIPNQDSITGAKKVLELVENCEEDDLLFVLISGGGSALLSYPKIKINDLQKTTDLLLKSGADIKEINTIRKHLSNIKGGQLVKKSKSRVVSLIISDIIGDPIDFIASGPTYPDSTTYLESEKILKKYDIWQKTPNEVRNVITDGKKGIIPETVKQNDPVFNKVTNFIVANNKFACYSAIKKAEQLGYKTMLLTTSLEGEASSVGKYLSEKVIDYNNKQNIAFISGGETTVTIKGDGKGGRNQEMVLACIEKIMGKKVIFSSFATDGIDGMSDAAGAIADSYTLKRAKEKNLDYKKFLDNNNSNEFFKILDDLLVTGPTGTNVMDIQIVIKIL